VRSGFNTEKLFLKVSFFSNFHYLLLKAEGKGPVPTIIFPPLIFPIQKIPSFTEAENNNIFIFNSFQLGCLGLGHRSGWRGRRKTFFFLK